MQGPVMNGKELGSQPATPFHGFGCGLTKREQAAILICAHLALEGRHRYASTYDVAEEAVRQADALMEVLARS